MSGQDAEDEFTLVAAIERGDPRAYEELYRRHRGWVFALARRFTGSDEDALDVLQETFAYLWTRFPGFELRSTVRAFLFPVVKHTSLDIVRRRRRGPFAVADKIELAGPGAASGPGLGFLDLVKRLPDEQREVVVLRFAHDFRLAEIAQALDIPVGTVKSRLHNALTALREDWPEK